MSDVIRLLPDSVANQIAAGEVIQRPASVVKELVENAVDAGARQIDVLVTDAGKTCIQVIDDGKGMSETDARLAFERHATSKIREASDLFALHTMGFGSNFSVKNLFYNVPARRKFLKSNQTELSNILTEFERIVLVNPDISFTLHHNGTEMLNLPAIQLRQRIMGVFGKKLNQELLSMDVTTSMIRIHGFIGKPETARKKGARQFFFVNGRYMRHPYFHKAIADAYERLVPVGEQVSYFVYFEVDPAHIDVNIHPTKTEIKFENEQAIWQILSAAVKETLGRFNAVPSIDFDTEGMPDIPVFESSNQGSITPPSASYDPSYNPFNASSSSFSPSYSAASSYRKPATDWEPLFEGLERKTPVEQEPVEYPSEEPTLYDAHPEETVKENTTQHYQYKGSYILTSVKSGLMIINQQRAHVRILYDRYMRQIADSRHVSQRLLFPEMVHFAASEVPVLEEIKDDLEALGFDLSSLGGGSYAINGVPAGIEGLSPERLVTDLVQTAIEKGVHVKEEVQSVLALSLAKASAIVPGQVLTSEEMNNLVDGLFAVSTPNYTPDGKIVLAVVKEEEIEKLFK